MLMDTQVQRLRRFADGGDFDTDEAFFEALRELDSCEELHYLVQVLNWDDYRTQNALEWTLSHPKCDAGTALQIYWMNEPEGLNEAQPGNRDVPDSEAGAYQLQKKIEQLYLAGSFPVGDIAYDPRKEGYLPPSPADDSDAVRAIPIELRTPTTGAELGDFYDRY